MRFALVNPNWSFEGSIYFGCREPHLPIEFGYSQAILERHGHEVLLVDAHVTGLSPEQLSTSIAAFSPDITILATAPSYLFWRCPPPELRAPLKCVRALRKHAGILGAVGPHPSTTPAATLKKLDIDFAIRGEFETVLPLLAQIPQSEWMRIPSFSGNCGGTFHAGEPNFCALSELPALKWPSSFIRGHRHQHHRFDSLPNGPGAEVEGSRGCPFRCTFCAKENFRNKYRKRPMDVVLEEIEGLLEQGVEYIYFIDEIFLPDRQLLSALIPYKLKFGIQTRIDLWDHNALRLAGAAGCASIEAGIESVTPEGRAQWAKHSSLTLSEMADLLVFAKAHIPFVQANLIASESDGTDKIELWRAGLFACGVWANKPVPVFPYPGSPIYRSKWGDPDDYAWERAHEFYLNAHSEFSDIQEQQPLPLCTLESVP